jgi:hypothetical protein
MSSVVPHIAINVELPRLPGSGGDASTATLAGPLFGAHQDSSSVDHVSGTPLTVMSRILDHWLVVALPGVYAIVVAAAGWFLPLSSMVILVAVLTPTIAMVQLTAVYQRPCDVPPSHWTRHQKWNFAVWPSSIIVCFVGLGMVSWLTVTAQYVPVVLDSVHVFVCVLCIVEEFS